LKYVMDGPLCSVFGGPVAKVLDQSMYVGNMEQTIPMLVESTGLSFKTVQKAVERLTALRLVKKSRKIGNTQTYRFDAAGTLRHLLAWADQLKFRHTGQ